MAAVMHPFGGIVELPLQLFGGFLCLCGLALGGLFLVAGALAGLLALRHRGQALPRRARELRAAQWSAGIGATMVLVVGGIGLALGGRAGVALLIGP